MGCLSAVYLYRTNTTKRIGDSVIIKEVNALQLEIRKCSIITRQPNMVRRKPIAAVFLIRPVYEPFPNAS
jgi:hypothetical protein